MEDIIANLLQNFEEGKMNRRQLIQNLALAATTASVAAPIPAVAADTPIFKATALHHVSYTVADYAKTRDFFINTFGLKVGMDDGKRCTLSSGAYSMVVRSGSGPTPFIDHFGIAIENFDKPKVIAALQRRGLNPATGGTEQGVSIKDPNGFRIQVEKPKS
jgi:catechol 2,3-dioxygenase-like lactoylglutathione lyase family enzyme